MEQANLDNNLLKELEELRFQLEEAHETINAIRTGQVDAVVIKDTNGHQLYTLKTADQTYRVFIEKMSEGAVTINRDGIILYCNSRFAKMVNAPLQNAIGVSLNTFVPEASKALVQTIITGSWDDECREEVLLKNADGKDMHCLFSCNAIDLDTGIALSIIITDLSVLKETERLLQQRNEQLEEARAVTEELNNSLEATVKERTHDLLISREHFKLLTNNIVQMTWTNLPDGNVNSYNQSWYDYTGKDFAETAGFGWQKLIHPDDLAETTEKYLSALKTGEFFEMENRYRRHDGVYRWHLNRSKPLRNDKGDIIFWVGTATDIEEQKQQMDRKDEFIGIASHELKTPLTSLKGYLQLIGGYKKEELPALVKSYIGKAELSINKLQTLINDLLDVSKIKAGRLEYSLSEIDITELVNQCIENAEHIYPSYHFSKNVCEDCHIKGNAERLEQVIMNLVSNAVKYSQIDKDVTISAEKRGDKVRISVTDKGIGLSEDQQSRIFERFYRVADNKNMTSGLGMGLYISHEIISHHNGTIGVESQPGKGATFYFELPMA
jgi:two-component system phosphate regulon sensor histidine kinase PhoR